MNTEIKELSTKVESSEQDNVRLTQLRTELEDKRAEYSTLLVDKQYLDYATHLLKDSGIKTKIINDAVRTLYVLLDTPIFWILFQLIYNLGNIDSCFDDSNIFHTLGPRTHPTKLLRIPDVTGVTSCG